MAGHTLLDTWQATPCLTHGGQQPEHWYTQLSPEMALHWIQRLAKHPALSALTFCSRAPMVAGPSLRKNTCWLVGLLLSMESSNRRKEAIPSFSEGRGGEREGRGGEGRGGRGGEREGRGGEGREGRGGEGRGEYYIYYIDIAGVLTIKPPHSWEFSNRGRGPGLGCSPCLFSSPSPFSVPSLCSRDLPLPWLLALPFLHRKVHLLQNWKQQLHSSE